MWIFKIIEFFLSFLTLFHLPIQIFESYKWVLVPFFFLLTRKSFRIVSRILELGLLIMILLEEELLNQIFKIYLLINVQLVLTVSSMFEIAQLVLLGCHKTFMVLKFSFRLFTNFLEKIKNLDISFLMENIRGSILKVGLLVVSGWARLHFWHRFSSTLSSSGFSVEV